MCVVTQRRTSLSQGQLAYLASVYIQNRREGMSMATVLEVRQALADGGYQPIPTTGKIPPFSRWQKIENVSPSMLAAWDRNWPRARNTGILTRLTPTIDVDVLNEPAAIAIEELVCDRFEERGCILPRIGKPPKRAIPFRTTDPFAKITANLVAADGSTGEKIEFMCDGQQVVVAGIHPDTGKPYSWPLGNLTDIARDDLPDISAAEAQQLVDDIVELLCRDFGYSRAAGRPARKGNGAQGAPANDWQQLVDAILAGNELHASTRDLAAKMVRSGMNGGAVVNSLRGLMDARRRRAISAGRSATTTCRARSTPSRRRSNGSRLRRGCGNCANAGHGKRSATATAAAIVARHRASARSTGTGAKLADRGHAQDISGMVAARQ